jgi:hypothetical protein
LLALGVVAALFSGPVTSHAATGDLDPSFGNGGVSVFDFSARDIALGLGQEPDGKRSSQASSIRPATTSRSSD